MKKKLSKIMLLCILGDGNSFGGDFLSEDMRPEIKPQLIIEPSERMWCVRVCVYAWRDVCALMCACVYVCTLTCMYVCAYICALAHVHAYMYACVCSCLCLHSYVCVCMYGTCVCVQRARDTCMCASLPTYSRQKLKSCRKSTEMHTPHVILKSFSFIVRLRKMYI